LKNRTAISRLIAGALLSGKDVIIPGLGTFVGHEIPAKREEKDGRNIWSAPGVEYDFRESEETAVSEK